MISRKIFAFILCLTCLTLPSKVLAQEKTNAAVLVDEFGRLAVSQLIARLDFSVSQLREQPDAKIFIFSYRSDLELPGSTPRYLNGIKQYLIRDLRIAPEKIILIDGGTFEQRITQIWIAPAGAAPKPTIKPYETVFVDTDSARKYDEYYYSSSEGFGFDEYSYGFDSVNSLREFAEIVKKESRADAYVIVYPQYYVEETEDGDRHGKTIMRRRIRIDPANMATKMQEEIRNELINDYNLSAKTVKVINGGCRKLRQVELWILPRGEHPPVATPNAFPKISRRVRKK